MRVEGRGLDPLTTRVRAGGLIAAADLHPPGLAPSAILCVRRLRDPIPGRLSLRGDRMLPPGEWTREVAAALDRLAARAARPARDPVADDAEAVLFADRAEWLACLAIDWLDGRLASRWWWRNIAPMPDLARWVFRTWLDAIDPVPAALALLADARRVADFLAAWPEPACRTMNERLARRFGLFEIAKALTETDRVPVVSPATRPGPPWHRRASGPRVDDLGTEAQCLLGLGVMLRRAPAEARSPAFAAALARWRRERRGAPSTPRGPGTPGTTPPHRDVLRDDLSAGRPGRSPSPPGAAGPGPSRSSAASIGEAIPEFGPVVRRDPPPSRPGAREIPVPRRRQADRPEASHQPGRPDAIGTGGHGAPHGREEERPAPDPRPGELPGTAESEATEEGGSAIVHRRVPSAPGPARIETAQRQRGPDPGDGDREDEAIGESSPHSIATRYGGIFYLVNLGLYLGLYADFSSTEGDALGLPLGDFLALVGERLVGPALREDPIWGVLAELSGRGAGTEPGRGFEPPEAWRLLPEWLRPFPGRGRWAWSSAGGRLRLRHPAGFDVLDIPNGEGFPSEQLAGEAQAYRRYAAFEPVRDDADPEPRGLPLETWLGWLMPYLRVRLQRALGLDDPAGLPNVLIEHRATVQLASDRIDVVLSLETLPIAVRLSGLDRDPGWLPSLGRSLTFYFR
jgi:hypothetical protein